MTEQSKKIVVPPFLLRRLEAFRIVKGGETTYLLRDKIQDKTYDFDHWQFFILESLQGYETVEKLQSVFEDRFDRKITKAELDELFGSIADRRLFDETAASHPLLAPFTQRTYEVEDGKAKPKQFTGPQASAKPVTPAPAPAPVSGGGGLAAQAAAQAQADAQPTELPAGVQDALGMDWRTTQRMLGLFDPRPLLKLFGPALRAMRHLIYGVPLLLVAALYLIISYSDTLLNDLSLLQLDITLVEHLLFVFFTTHVVTTATAASVADSYKVQVDKVGITLTLGFIPRWVLKMTGADRLSRTQTMWLHGSMLLARTTLFSLGVLLWYGTRDSQTALTQVGLLMLFTSGAGLVLEAGNPLIKANGYYLLSAYLNEPHLRGKAFAALWNKFRGGLYKAADSTLLAIYALASATYVIFIILLAGSLLAKFVLGELNLGGSAIIVTVAFAAVLLWRNYDGLKKFGITYERQVQFDRWRTRTLKSETDALEVKPTKAQYWQRALLVCSLLLLLLPYAYEPGGVFTVFPARKAVLTTDVAGVVREVMFDGGEAVKQGTVLARLAADDYEAQIKVLDADIEEQRQVVANLKALPKPEEVKVAEQQLEVAKSHVPFSRDKLQRLEKLAPTGAITLEEVEAARKEADLDRMQVIEKEAALALAKVGATKEQIAAAEAKLASLQEQRSGVVGRVDRGALRMPFDGNILTLHLKDKINSYLGQGATFAEVENTGSVTVEIEIIESDVPYIQVGSKVRARPTSYFNEEYEGQVTLIDRNVTKKAFGNVIKVIATFDNKAGNLRTGMVGQAKVTAVTMPVWKAFTHSIVRFVRLQLWAWIP